MSECPSSRAKRVIVSAGVPASIREEMRTVWPSSISALRSVSIRARKADISACTCSFVKSKSGIGGVPRTLVTAKLLIDAGAEQLRCDVAAVSVVAVGVGRDPTQLGRALDCIPPRALASSVSPLRLSAVVPRDDAPALEQAWHALFA